MAVDESAGVGSEPWYRKLTRDNSGRCLRCCLQDRRCSHRACQALDPKSGMLESSIELSSLDRIQMSDLDLSPKDYIFSPTSIARDFQLDGFSEEIELSTESKFSIATIANMILYRMRCWRLVVSTESTMVSSSASGEQPHKRVSPLCGEVTLPTLFDTSQPKPWTSLSVIPISRCSSSRRSVTDTQSGWPVTWLPVV